MAFLYGSDPSGIMDYTMFPDVYSENMDIQKAKRGDILAVLVTGAYNYSMASNYNRLPRPPVILIKDGKARVAVRRETYEDIVRNDI